MREFTFPESRRGKPRITKSLCLNELGWDFLNLR